MKPILSLFLCCAMLGAGPAAATEPELRPDLPVLQERVLPLDALVGESLVYDIAFLWFDRIAEGRLSFSAGERPGTYRAVLEARTLGVAAWLTNERIQRYVSVMEPAPDGRLRSLSFESHIIKSKGGTLSDITNRYNFDYEKRQVRYQRARKGDFYKDELLPMAAGQAPPNDVLTAFYNFRAGIFGPIKPGSRYAIPTFSRKGKQEIVVEVLTAEQRPANPFFPGGGLLVRVTMDEEVLDTQGGAVYVWLDDFGRPQRGIVENVIGLGHVRGTLRQ